MGEEDLDVVFVKDLGCERRVDLPCLSMLTKKLCVQSECKPFICLPRSPSALYWTVVFW